MDAKAHRNSAGHRPVFAWTCCDYAGGLFQRNGPETKATSLLDEALAISSELGMRPLMERVRPGGRFWGPKTNPCKRRYNP